MTIDALGKRRGPNGRRIGRGRRMSRPYTLYTLAERQAIIAQAVRDGLSARQVQARFGVNAHTYYSWRKKAGLRGPRGRRPRQAQSTT